MVYTTMTELFFLAVGLVVAAGLFWKAHRSREQRAWRILGALGWVVLALSGVTDGRIGIAITTVALAVLGLAVFVRRKDVTKDAEAA